MKKIFKHELIEIKIPAGSSKTQINIPDQPNLRSVKITGVNFYDSSSTPKSPISQINVIGIADLQKVFLTLLDFKNFEFLKLAPARTLMTLVDADGGAYEHNPAAFTGQIVNYPKSYVTFSEAIAPENDIVILFSVYYIELGNDSKIPYSKKR